MNTSQADIESFMASEDVPEKGLFRIGVPLLESEDTAEYIYTWLLTLMAKEYRTGWSGLSASELRKFETKGVYIPAASRLAYWDMVDGNYLDLPHYMILGAVAPEDKGKPIHQSLRAFFTAQRLDPKEFRGRRFALPLSAAQHYRIRMWMDLDKDGSLTTGSMYASIRNKDGKIVPFPWASDAGSDPRLSELRGAVTGHAAMVFNAYVDREHLWLVDTLEQLDVDRVQRIQLGVEPEMVKSLFYARSLPVTPAGRKRPILHWVNAHQRRIREGIEIDISKHLRGIDSFLLGGLNMQISQPRKRPAQRRDERTGDKHA